MTAKHLKCLVLASKPKRVGLVLGTFACVSRTTLSRGGRGGERGSCSQREEGGEKGEEREGGREEEGRLGEIVYSSHGGI